MPRRNWWICAGLTPSTGNASSNWKGNSLALVRSSVRNPHDAGRPPEHRPWVLAAEVFPAISATTVQTRSGVLSGPDATRNDEDDMKELNDEAIRLQAEALEDYLRKGGDPVVWLASKYFTRDDAYAVSQELRRLKQERAGRSA